MVFRETIGLVLAAGAGSRYGVPKILVPGWLDRAVGSLREGGCSSVYVVTGAARPPLPTSVTETYCAGWQRGIGASLRAGLSALKSGVDRVVLHVVDCPDIGPDVVARVVDSANGQLTRAVFDGRPGHPVVVPRQHLNSLLAALTDDDGAGPYLRKHSYLEVECGDLATGRDIDTPPEASASRHAGFNRRQSAGVEPGGDQRA